MRMVIQRGKHVRRCRYAGNGRRPWVCAESFFGNWAGNEGKGRDCHMWLRFKCNDPSCGARLLVLEEFAVLSALKSVKR